MRPYWWVILLAGCAVKSHDYGAGLASAADETADGLATVYVARPSVYGFAVKFPMEINGEYVTPLSASRYISQGVSPGRVEIKAKGEKMCTVTFDAEADRSYYFLARVRSGWLFARVQLEALEPGAGVDTVARCSISQ